VLRKRLHQEIKEALHAQILHKSPYLRNSDRHHDHACRPAAIKTLPVSQYPPIAPPQITINALYPGASAQTVQDTVTQVIEQKMNALTT